jgi:hypothetical protein
MVGDLLDLASPWQFCQMMTALMDGQDSFASFDSDQE